MAIITRWQYRADTAANWTASNPTLAAGEIGVEKDTQGVKVGDGVTAWAALPYLFPVGGTLAAIGTLITGATPQRTADAGNTRASAALPGGGAWDGAGRLTDDPGVFARVDADMTCPVDAAGMFYVIHGPTVAAVDGCNPAAPALPCRVDAWPTVVVWANHRAPVAFRDKAFRLAWRGTAGSVVAVTATLDPRPVNARVAIDTPGVLNVAHLATQSFNIPPGARTYVASVVRSDANPPGNSQIFLRTAAPATVVHHGAGLINGTDKREVYSAVRLGAVTLQFYCNEVGGITDTGEIAFFAE